MRINFVTGIIVSIVLVFGLFGTPLSAVPNVEARVYSPGCPGYFSVSVGDFRFSYFLASDIDPSSVATSSVIYSFRNGWTSQSWSRSPALLLAKAGPQSGLYLAEINGIEVASRGSYTMSHIEFAIKWTFKDGRELWDNGNLGALSFYSAPLPATQCFGPEYWYLNVQAFADANQYNSW